MEPASQACTARSSRDPDTIMKTNDRRQSRRRVRRLWYHGMLPAGIGPFRLQPLA
ncbi:hypothetical protein SAMN05880582_103226 [Rhizobium sp. RU20A]|uniref:hypothetical protein n=1 Tax=Rhizobium sp. RU20A TaxID=1907412 RepID=UPI0009559F36|nr:hypothetical protein [Rhizobium sp. RU20A]SIQ75356.1 hypothetical protein SAMN05880582_103226 [Rhizobium sp. RU20A]